MVKRQAEPSVTVGPEGVTLTPFANEICLQEDLEVSLASLPVTVNDIRFPMCLVAASVGRHKAVRPRTDGIPVWPLHQVPSAMMQCSVEMPSGHTLFPFADSPHITQEGFIIHGSNPEPGPKSIACYYIVRSQATLEKQPERSLTIFNGFGKTMLLYRFSPSGHSNILNIGRPRPLPSVGPPQITPQPEGPLMPRAVPHFEIFQRPPQGQAGIYASQPSRPGRTSPSKIKTSTTLSRAMLAIVVRPANCQECGQSSR